MTGEKERQRVVPADEILEKIEQGEPVEYKGDTIGQGLDITRLKLPKDEDGKLIVSSSIKIVNSHIQGIVNFEDVVFKEFIDFRNSKFDLASFQEAKFCKYAAFESTIFGGYGQFSHVHFIGDAIFSNVQFIGDADFFEAKFKGDAFFWSMDDGKTTFSGEARFEFAEFCNHVTFHQATFCEKANFQLARFIGKEALFMGAHFKGGADFRGARFEGAADFRWSKLNKYLNLTRTKIITFEVEWESIKYILECDKTVYLALVNSFKNLGRLDDADNCYYQYRRMSQNEKPWYEKRKKWLHRFNWSKLYDHVAWRSCGYGVRLIFTIIWIFVFIFGFASFYRIFEGITKYSPPEIIMTALNNSTILFSSSSAETSPSLWVCLYYSAVSFAGGTPAGLSPVGAWKYAVMFESVLGYLLLALFIVVLARKLIR